MHLPDGIVGAPANITLGVTGAAVVGAALRKANRDLGERRVPLMATCAAFIFAAQMLNFPVGPGVSGHFLGAALAAILFGPLLGSLVMTLVIVLQCVVFGDGGVTALGSNVFVMGVVGPFSAWAVYGVARRVLGGGRAATIAAGGIAAWVSILCAALVCALLISVFGYGHYYRAAPVLALMATVHALIGLGEAVITASVLSVLLAARPDLVPGAARMLRPAQEAL